MLLRWWLAKSTLARQPRPNEVTNWYAFAANNFIYRGTWGLGSVIGLLLDTTDDGQPIRALGIADWPLSGLPWIRSEENTSALQSLMRHSYAVFCLKKKRH